MKIYWIGYWFASQHKITAASPDGWLDECDLNLAIVEFTEEDARNAFGKVLSGPQPGGFFLMESEI